MGSLLDYNLGVITHSSLNSFIPSFAQQVGFQDLLYKMHYTRPCRKYKVVLYINITCQIVVVQKLVIIHHYPIEPPYLAIACAQ